MTMRQIARQILPPFITNALIRMMRGRGRGAPEWEYVPGGWQHGGLGRGPVPGLVRDEEIAASDLDRRAPVSEAKDLLSAQSAKDATGWNVESVVRAQRAKWDRFVALIGGTSPLAVYHESAVLTNDSITAHHSFLTYGYVLARAAAHVAAGERLSILDWGSGLGHYFLISRALLPDVAFDYHARDLPLMCAAGRELLPEVTFHETDAAALAALRRYDLILASSSLQYQEAWRDLLRAFAAASRRFVYITRLPIVHHAPTFVVVQRPHAIGYETAYQCWFLNRDELLAGAREAGLRLVREFLVDERPHVPGAPEQCEFRGFLFEVA